MNRLLVLTILLELASLGLSSAAHACSLRRDWLIRPHSYFLASPLPDTMLAGPGPVSYVTPRRVVPDPSRPIYGLMVRIERLGGSPPPALVGAIQAGIREVVLVPWSYGADCRTIPWMSSARWAEPGVTGLFSASLRDEEQWVDGRPTLDVLRAGFDPYPHGYAVRASAPDSMLTAEQLFSFYSILPTREAVEADPWRAIEPLFRWAEANPELAGLYPASEALKSAYAELQPCVSRTGISPIAGTYRLTITAADAPARELFIRTSARPKAPECRKEVRQENPGRFAPRSAESYWLNVHGAATEAAIPETNREARETACSVSSLRVAEDALTSPSGARIWRAHLDWGMLERCFGSQAKIRRAVEHYRQQLRSGRASRLHGEFRAQPDGTVEFEQVLTADGAALLSVRGERIPEGRTLDY